MQRVSQRSTPLWVWIVGGIAVVFALIFGLILFFGVSGLLFTWVSGVTQGTSGQPQQLWGVPVGRMLYASDWEGDFEIYIEKASRGSIRPVRITHDTGTDTNPAFSPTGDQIVFQSDRDGHENLYIMDVDGGNLTQITDNENDNWQPDWSPDGEQIVFSALGEDGKRHLYLIGIDGSGLTQLTFNGHDTQPAWSPDGSQIVFVRPSDTSVELYVIDADGSNEKLLISKQGIESDPRWSPDGSQIVFVLTRSRIANVYTVKSDGTNLKMLYPGTVSAFNKCPVWSPDGRYMAMVWGQPNSTYQSIQFYEIGSGGHGFSGGASSGGTIQGCDWGN